jgi:hypothetical protein
VLGTAALADGVATFTTSDLAAGSHTLTASYGGDSSFAASTSAEVTQTVNAAAVRYLAVGADEGADPRVRVYDAATGAVKFEFLAYDVGFRGGVRVAVGDVNGDGTPDVITGAGPGGLAHVKVFSGTDLTLLASFAAFDPGFRGGVYVAAGRFDGGTAADVVVGAGEGGLPHVRVFSISGGAATQLSGPLGSFAAYDPAFRGGVHVAAGNVDGAAGDELITGAGPGGLPHVKVFRSDGSVLGSFGAYDLRFRGGVFVAAGDVDADGRAEIVTGAGPGGTPHVEVFNGSDSTVRSSFLAYGVGFTGGVRVGLEDRDGDGRADVVTGAGPGAFPHVRVFNALAQEALDQFYAFDAQFRGGVFVG